jgi:hypothetical protein
VVLYLLLGAVEWAVVLVGQGLVLLLSERESRRVRALRSLAYWVVIALLLWGCTQVRLLELLVVLPMFLLVAAPIDALWQALTR